MPVLADPFSIFLSFILQKKSDSEQGLFQMERISHAKNIMKPFVLRRLKKDVLKELPKKNHSVIMVPLSDLQSQIYSSFTKEIAATTSSSLASMQWLTKLRFTANHHQLLRWRYTDSKLRTMAKRILTVSMNHRLEVYDMNIDSYLT